VGLERDHYVRNLIDRIDDLERRLEELERSTPHVVIGPYTAGAPTADGYVLLTLYVSGVATNYRVLVDAV
jgi:hypothetical protein